MRLLLDTHLLLWALGAPDRLDAATRDLVEDQANDVLFSAVSIWEVAIKAALGRASFAVQPDSILISAQETGFIEVPVHASVAALVASLPLYHRDPFDRLLIAQAMAASVQLYTADAVLLQYTKLVRVVG